MLRGLQTHLKGDFEVCLIGPQIPKWLQNVQHLVQTKGKLKTALVMAANAFPDGFSWWYDDVVLIQDQTIEQVKVCPAKSHRLQVNTTWVRDLYRIRDRLIREGHPDRDYSTPHGPYWFDKGMIDEAFRDWPGMEKKFPFETWILSKRNAPHQTSDVVAQYYGAFRTPPHDGKIFLNWDDSGMTPELVAWLANKFPDPSPYEKIAEHHFPAVTKKVEHTVGELSETLKKIRIVCLNGYPARRKDVEASIEKNGGVLAQTKIEWFIGTPSEQMVCPPSFRKNMIRRHWWAATCDHIKILEQAILQNDDYLLVIEDDAKFAEDFHEVLVKSWVALPVGWKALRLGWNGNTNNGTHRDIASCGNEQGMIATLWSKSGILRFYDHVWHRRNLHIDAQFADLRRLEPNAGWYQTPKRIITTDPLCVQRGNESSHVAIMPHKGGGLFSQINKIITVMEEWQTNKIEVDWTNMPFYVADGNLYESLFVSSKLVGNKLEIVDYPHWEYTGKFASKLYRGNNDWRIRLHRWWAQLKVQPDILNEADDFYNKNQPMIALHVRNYSISSESENKQAPTLEQYRQAVAELPGKIFLATDNVEAVTYFENEFPERMVTRKIPRSPDMQTELHKFRENTLEDAKNCLVDAVVMSKCAMLVHGVSNIATSVLYMNPYMPHIYVVR